MGKNPIIEGTGPSQFFQSKKQQTANADQEPRRARRVDYSAKAICKLYEIKCSICNKYVGGPFLL